MRFLVDKRALALGRRATSQRRTRRGACGQRDARVGREASATRGAKSGNDGTRTPVRHLRSRFGRRRLFRLGRAECEWACSSGSSFARPLQARRRQHCGGVRALRAPWPRRCTRVDLGEQTDACDGGSLPVPAPSSRHAWRVPTIGVSSSSRDRTARTRVASPARRR